MKAEFIRNDWITRSRFAALSDREVLRALQTRVEDEVSSGQTPVVVLDLDSTLYEVGPRTLKIVRDWAASSDGRAYASLRSAIDRIELPHVGYSLRDTLSEVGASAEEPGFESLKNFWARRFFSNHELIHDRPYDGASTWVRHLYDRGAMLVYLTGRDRPNMLEGTIANLERDAFPLDQKRTHLMLKAHSSVSDVEHKVTAVEQVSKLGSVVAQFENEPKNFVALARAFPKAMHVFMHTVSSDHPAEPVTHPEFNVYRIRSFEASGSL